ncbi:hypothetical protein [Aulosira sp. FACHB-615]|uniref:hypothetical protein n=1 Tax=Aulosira sp. FACHB-615 TaxID=2692777 RepID=UPI0016828E34|nr:hypothetical protein [Aulosira sp. FACHB-615]MBD2491126.1 hypothetical protein [Aulosira sp. FACHB-615]
MITENVENTKSQAQRIWGNQEAVQPGADSYRSRGFGQESREDGIEPISISGDDWTGGNFTSSGGQGTPGGIVDRLITKVEGLIEESEYRTAELRKQLEELKQLSNQLHSLEKNAE